MHMYLLSPHFSSSHLQFSKLHIMIPFPSFSRTVWENKRCHFKHLLIQKVLGLLVYAVSTTA